jgi:hypothetical protein
MKIETPFGAYPFQVRRIERRGGSIAVVGTPAGLETSVIVGLDDLWVGAKVLAPAAAAALLVTYLRTR